MSFSILRLTDVIPGDVEPFTATGTLEQVFNKFLVQNRIPADHPVTLLKNPGDPSSFFVIYDDVPKPMTTSGSGDGSDVDKTVKKISYAAATKGSSQPSTAASPRVDSTTPPSVSTRATPNPLNSSRGTVSPQVNIRCSVVDI